MEKRGLKNVPPIKPFDLSVGAKELFRIWDFSELTEMSKFYIAGSDLLLLSEKKKGVTHPGGMAIKADARGEDLRFGYVLLKELFKLASIKGLIFLLQLFAWMGLFFIGIHFLTETFSLLKFGPWVAGILCFAILLPPSLLYWLYDPYIKPRRRQKEIDKIITEIAESMGGKQITPFKRTTVELED
jgi:membrane protein implicated in regulation of membrane protease activity